MKRLPHIVTAVLGLLLLILIMSLANEPEVSAMNQPLIIVLSSSQLEPYLQAVKGFKKRVKDQFPEARIDTFFLGQDSTKNLVTMQKIDNNQPDVLFTLGSKATRKVQTVHPDRPQVVTMILDGLILEQSKQATGVFLNFPPAVHLNWLRRLLPNAKRVYLLYNSQENSTLYTEIKKAATVHQLEIYGVPVDTISQLPAALNSVGRQADILLGLPDQTVYSGKTAKVILLSTFRNRIPFAGLSRYWVKAGALYALDWDYHDLGRQCGEMTCRILMGDAVSDIAPAPPDKVRYIINMKTADYLKLTIDPTLVQEAAEVFQ
ncbi:MAG: ABC transporter substrate-binding protein [Proteobacteria bacterium]|nr:ABC transporter substrate-binding protein [Pseudomonadota bacterium]MBU1137721.1 ABC transporter substrate-binding protein [Pseudomonadota bacterium]MBU1231959.1 ABC transporter substrate-binding protein [Pseudomonadota bacterium]MBU1418833.1 ABC transporter substrate-binding protein [Pseudomonadota bacterium]MBU1455743.1 ABC transporter substrate-binding protein [Pseudomonadota bacterium]